MKIKLKDLTLKQAELICRANTADGAPQCANCPLLLKGHTCFKYTIELREQSLERFGEIEIEVEEGIL